MPTYSTTNSKEVRAIAEALRGGSSHPIPKLEVWRCTKHDLTALMIADGDSCTRLTPGKCCGSWDQRLTRFPLTEAVWDNLLHELKSLSRRERPKRSKPIAKAKKRHAKGCPGCGRSDVKIRSLFDSTRWPHKCPHGQPCSGGSTKRVKPCPQCLAAS